MAMFGLLIVMVALPPATSTDFNSYAFYGRMVSEYGVSPYVHAPRDMAADYWYPRISYFWSDAPSVYGPVFTGVAAAIMAVAGTSVLTARLGFGLVAAFSVICAVLLASRRLGISRATLLIGLNPLILTFGVNDAHCDVLAGALVLGGALAIADKRVVFGAAALSAAALVKVSLLPALAGAFVWLWFRNARREALMLASSATAIFVVAFGIAGGTDALKPLLGATSRHTRFSMWNPVYDLLRGWFGAGLPGHSNADKIVGILSLISVVIVTCALWWRYRKESTPFLAIAGGLVAYQLLGAYVLSWYAIWSLGVLAFEWRRRLFGIAMIHGAWVALAYLSGWLALVLSPLVLYGAFTLYGAGKTNESANLVNSSGSE